MQCETMPPPRYVVLLPLASVMIFAGFPGLLTKSRSQLRGRFCALAAPPPAKPHKDPAAGSHLAPLTVWEEASWVVSWPEPVQPAPLWGQQGLSIHLSQ